MLQFIREYAAFNLWANQRICSVVEKMSDEQFNREVTSSFPSIRKTLLHVWGANEIWLKRIEGVSLKAMPTENFGGGKKDIIDGFIASSQKLKELSEQQNENSILVTIEYSTLKGESFTSPLYQILAHVCNHATYHRGQIVTMFRQVGLNEIPSTDLSFFYRQ